MYKVYLPCAKLAGIAMLAANDKKDYRRQLFGVFVEVKGREVRLTATTGELLGTVGDTDKVADENEVCPDYTSFILPASELAGMPKQGTVTLAFAETGNLRAGTVTVSHAKGTRLCAPIDGVFPDWRRVLPTIADDKAATPAHLDPALVATMGKAVSVLTDSKGHCMYLAHPGDGSSSVGVYAPACPEFAGVIMPIRAGWVADNVGDVRAKYNEAAASARRPL